MRRSVSLSLIFASALKFKKGPVTTAGTQQSMQGNLTSAGFSVRASSQGKR